MNAVIYNPGFTSQCKDVCNSKNFAPVVFSEDFIIRLQNSQIVEKIMQWAKDQEKTQLTKNTKKNTSNLKSIEKLEDANEAGGKNAGDCTLILTEGESAKTLAMAGLGVIDRDKYGIYPLKGKLLNVRDAPHNVVMKSKQISNLAAILGLDFQKTYEKSEKGEEEMKSLRYGKLMIMADQDVDGSHITSRA